MSTPPAKARLWPQILIVIATVIWGSTFFILKDTLDNVSVFFLLAFRFSLAAALLALLFWNRWKTIDKSYFFAGGVMGTFLFSAYAVQTFGLMGTTPGKNAFFTAVYCVIVPFLYWAIRHVRPDRYNIAAALMCLAGVGLVSWDGGFFLSLGDGLTLISGFLYACHIVAVAHYARGRDIIPLTILQFAMVALWSWAFSFATGALPADGLPTRAWLVLLYLALAATALALLFQNVGQAHTSPSAAAVLLSLEAPFGVLFSVLFAQERPTPFMYCGFLLIFLAVILSETKLSFLRRKTTP